MLRERQLEAHVAGRSKTCPTTATGCRGGGEIERLKADDAVDLHAAVTS
jgi:hypothetical protein